MVSREVSRTGKLNGSIGCRLSEGVQRRVVSFIVGELSVETLPDGVNPDASGGTDKEVRAWRNPQ